jgi:hypothetical protein
MDELSTYRAVTSVWVVLGIGAVSGAICGLLLRKQYRGTKKVSDVIGATVLSAFAWGAAWSYAQAHAFRGYDLLHDWTLLGVTGIATAIGLVVAIVFAHRRRWAGTIPIVVAAAFAAGTATLCMGLLLRGLRILPSPG